MAASRGKRINRFIVLCLALVIVLAATTLAWVYSSLPRSGGDLTLPGLKSPVTVHFDENAVPYIFAETELDAAFALGFTHARDRMWQMELQRRLGAGRLSEIIGKRTTAIDRQMRTLGFYRHSVETLKGLSPDVRATLKAYAAGVNAWIDNRHGALPPEFLLLRHEPEPWQPADSVVWGKLMGMRLSGNFRDELLRARLAANMPEEKIRSLWPSYPKDAPVTVDDHASAWPTELLDRMLSSFSILTAPPHGASNAWAIDGSKTKSGKPILANDPHLRFDAPILWYLARIKTPALELTGATVPGVPQFLLGHNGHLAWGFTTTQSDLQDVFIEKVDPENPNRYLSPEGPKRFLSRKEVIKVRDGEDIELLVRETRHGPVISDIFGNPTAPTPGGDTVLALATTFLTGDDLTPQSLFKLNRAKRAADARLALSEFHTPQLNVVYADQHGEIGYVAAGRLPIRARGDGYFPSPGWTGEYDWQGFVPFSELPSSVNPDRGKIVTANNKVVGPDYPHFISHDWAPGYRADRIETALADQSGIGLGQTAEIQLDIVSAMAQRLLPVMLKPLAKQEGRAKEAAELLSKWDGSMMRTRPEPAIFTAWLRILNRDIYKDELGGAFAQYWGFRPTFMLQVLKQDSSWCNDISTPERETCGSVLTQSLTAALKELETRFGSPEITDWRWGTLHEAQFEHPVFKGIPVLKNLSSLRIPSDGGSFTVNRGAMRPGNEADPFHHVHGAGFRALYDLSDLSKSRFIIATGQSGNFLSPHYRDFLSRWADGEYVKLDKSRQTLEASGGSRLSLLPQ